MANKNLNIARILAGAIATMTGSLALAAPTSLRIEGTLFDQNGAPVGATTSVKVVLWKDSSSTAPADKLWDPAACSSVVPYTGNGKFSYTVTLTNADVETLANLDASDQIWAEILMDTSGTCSHAVGSRFRAKGSVYAAAADWSQRALTADAVTANVSASQITAMTGASGVTAGTQGAVPAPAAGAQNKFLRGDGTWQDIPSGSGTMTSFGLSMPAEFSVTGSPITSSGTIAVSLVAQDANKVFAGPASGGAAAPTFRALVEDDIPNLSLSKISSGTLGIARGGLAGGVGDAFTTLGLGTLASTPSTWITTTGGTIDGVTISTSSTAVLGNFDANLSEGKIWIGSAGGVSTATALRGDATLSSSGQLTIVGLRGLTVASAAPSNGDFMKWNDSGTKWEPGVVSSASTTLIGVSSGPKTLATNKSYIIRGAGRITTKLPSTCNLGDSVNIYGQGAGGWTLAPGANQTIWLDGLTVSSPASLKSPYTRSNVELVCTSPNAHWTSVSSSLTGATVTPALPQDLSQKFTGYFNETWAGAGVDSANASRIYAVSQSGSVYKSTDTGGTWTLQCSVGTAARSSARIRFSSDGTVYIISYYGIYKAQSLSGAACPSITVPTGSFGWNLESLAIAANGDLYLWMNKNSSSGQGYIHKSTDQGSSWSQISIETNNLASGHLIIDPFDATNFLLYKTIDYSYVSAKIFRSTNSGSSFTQVASGGTLAASPYTWDSYNVAGPFFDPAHQNYVYTTADTCSSDAGATWSACSDLDDLIYVDATGKGYRTTQSGVTLQVQTAPDLRTPTWSTLTGTMIAPGASPSYDSLSAVSTAIAVTTSDGKLFISSDSGNSFAGVTLIDPNPAKIVSIDTADAGATLYAIDGAWHIFKSTDGGVNWSLKYSPGATLSDADTTPLLWVHPLDSNKVYVRAETWNSAYRNDFMSSLDGFDTATETDTAGIYSWSSAWMLKLSDPLVIQAFAWNNSLLSTTGTVPFSSVAGPNSFVWYPWLKNYMKPSDTNISWFGEVAWNGGSYGKLWEYDRTTFTSTDISSRVGFNSPSGMDMIDLGGGSYKLRIFNANGQVSESTDDAQTFTAKTLTTPVTTSCSRWAVASHPANSEVIALGCMESTQYAYSSDGGVNWTSGNISSLITNGSSCKIWNMAVTDFNLIISCAVGGYTSNTGAFVAGPFAVPY